MKICRLLFCISVACVLLCSCGKTTYAENNDGPEENKVIAKERVQLEGTHSTLIQVTGEAQVRLAVSNKREWKIDLYVPLSNTQTWNQWKSQLTSDKDYDAAMSGMQVLFIDANNTPISCRLEHNEDNIESLLSAEVIATETFYAKTYASGSYDEMKNVFDQIKGIALRNMDLDEFELSTATQSLGEDEDFIDFEGIREDARKEYKEAIERNND